MTYLLYLLLAFNSPSYTLDTDSSSSRNTLAQEIMIVPSPIRAHSRTTFQSPFQGSPCSIIYDQTKIIFQCIVASIHSHTYRVIDLDMNNHKASCKLHQVTYPYYWGIIYLNCMKLSKTFPYPHFVARSSWTLMSRVHNKTVNITLQNYVKIIHRGLAQIQYYWGKVLD